jgi:hypothetical protein
LFVKFSKRLCLLAFCTYLKLVHNISRMILSVDIIPDWRTKSNYA